MDEERQQIAGIIPIDVSEDPYLGLTDNIVSELKREYENSLLSTPPFPLPSDGNLYRYPELVIGRYSGSPTQVFAINESLLVDIEEKLQEGVEFISEKDLLNLSLKNSNGTCNPEFSSDAINDLNQLYFSFEGAFLPIVGLSTLLSYNRPVNQAISRVIDYHFSLNLNKIYVKEISCGENEHRWNIVGESIRHRNLEIILTDFHENIDLPKNITVPNIKIDHELYDLMDDFPVLLETQKIDVMLATYVFDTVWQDKDFRYVKYHDKWYKSGLRLRVLDWHRKKNEVIQSLLTLKPFPDMTMEDFDGIFIEEALIEISLENEPFGKYIEEEFKGFRNVKVNFPGGLINTIKQAFQNQLSKNGIFLIGDVAIFEQEERDNALRAYGISGSVGRFKVEDYLLAKKILEQEYNFKVEISSLHKFVNTYLGPEWENHFNQDEVSNVVNTKSNCFMKVWRS